MIAEDQVDMAFGRVPIRDDAVERICEATRKVLEDPRVMGGHDHAFAPHRFRAMPVFAGAFRSPFGDGFEMDDVFYSLYEDSLDDGERFVAWVRWIDGTLYGSIEVFRDHGFDLGKWPRDLASKIYVGGGHFFGEDGLEFPVVSWEALARGIVGARDVKDLVERASSAMRGLISRASWRSRLDFSVGDGLMTEISDHQILSLAVACIDDGLAGKINVPEIEGIMHSTDRSSVSGIARPTAKVLLDQVCKSPILGERFAGKRLSAKLLKDLCKAIIEEARKTGAHKQRR